MIDPSQVKQQDPNAEPVPLKRLDIACGDTKPEGWVGIDIASTPSVDVQHDLFTFPWPFEDASFDEARCSHFFEHVPQGLRGAFMSEVWRVLKPGAGCTFITPKGFDRQVQDPSHQWPPIVVGSYYYYDRAWLRLNKLDHYIGLLGINCDFEVRPLEISVIPEFQLKNMEHRVFAVQHYANAAVDLVTLMVKRGELG